MRMNMVKSFFLTTPLGRIALILPRTVHALISAGVMKKAAAAVRWGLRCRDPGVRAYRTDKLNQYELCSVISFVSRRPLIEVLSYNREIQSDELLEKHIRNAVSQTPEKWSHDAEYQLGRRLAYYLLVRSLRPKFVVEAGVDRGLGALVISRALERNAAEGAGGDYLGIEADGGKEPFLYSRYPGKIGNVMRGDSATEIAKLKKKIDLFIHETCTEPKHVKEQIGAVRHALAGDGVIAVPWLLDDFIDFAMEDGRRFLTHKDQPLEHWYEGSRMVFLFRDG
jgi:hypothetical protein